jgi:hypothetical protein
MSSLSSGTAYGAAPHCSQRSKGSPSRWTRRRPHGIVPALTRARIALPLSTPASRPGSACWVATRTRRPAPAARHGLQQLQRRKVQRRRLARQLPECRAGVCALASTCGGLIRLRGRAVSILSLRFGRPDQGAHRGRLPRPRAGTEGGDVERCGSLASHGEHFKLFAEYRRAVVDMLADNSPWRHW